MIPPTVGVEEEYQLVDPESGALRSRADRVLGVAWSEDLEIVSAGTHPFSHWRAHRMAAGPRPRMLAARFGRVAMDEHIFGMHVHVALPDAADPARLLTQVRWITPVLLGLSCSSPYFQGDDTGYASYRSIVQRPYPLTGPPPRLESMAEHDRLLDSLTRGGLIPDRHTVYWNVRLSARHPTIEFRGADACPSLHEAAAIAAIARAAVAYVADGGSLAPGVGRAADVVGWILEEGNAADRLRRIHARRQDMIDLVDWLREETQAGLYRSGG